MDVKKFAVVAAGGIGSRLPSDCPKQFLEAGGKPVLMHSIEAFYRYSPTIEIIVALSEREMSRWKMLCVNFQFLAPHRIVAGGSSRYYSVRNALDSITHLEGLVAIHDGARPLVSSKLIEQSFRLAQEKGAAVPAVPLKDSIRKIEGERNMNVRREDFRLVQTPQTFRLSLIKEAYSNSSDTVTDDASAAEQAGFPVFLFEGDEQNIKITAPTDLLLAEALFKNNKN